MNINFDVPLDDNGQNANLIGHVLDEQTMNEHGFYLDKDEFWRFSISLHPKAHISMYISIFKDHVFIHIIDDDFMQPYDYQRYGNGIIWDNIRNVMQDLTDAGIITGYKRNDYI